MTAPNVLTALRTGGALAFWAVAVRAENLTWLIAALVCYWVGDMADGLLARLTGAETRTGALLDVLADRLCVCLIVVTYTAHHPEATVPAALFVFQFVLLDAYLTLTFGNWSLLSPNYFHLVDPTVYRLNWSVPAKAVNTAAVVLAVLVVDSTATATALACVLLAVKTYSVARVARIPVPRVRTGCAVLDAVSATR